VLSGIATAAQLDATSPATGLHRSEWRASTFTASSQSDAALALTDDGRVVTTWSSRRQQGGRYGIYAQQFTTDGIAIGQETVVNLWPESHQTLPAIAAGSDGATWIAWTSHGQDGQAGAIVARRFDGEFRGGSEILVNSTTAGHQTAPVLATMPDGRVLVAWQSTIADDRPTRIRARLIGPDGRTRGDEFGLGLTHAGHETVPCVAVLPDGRFAIAFAVTDASNHPAGIRLQRFDRDGQPVGKAIDASGPRRLSQIEPALAPAAGGYLLAWLDAESDGSDYGVLARLINADGQPRTEPFVVNTITEGPQTAAAVTAAADGTLTVAFNSTDEDGLGIFIQRIDGTGKRIGRTDRLTGRTTGEQRLRAAAGTVRLLHGPDGRLICAWSGDAGRGDASSANLTMLSRAPIELAGRVQGVTDAMSPAVVLARADGAAGPGPHEPPLFDPDQIDEGGSREIFSFGNTFGFTGIFDTGWTPPDPEMAVGPDHVVLMTNGKIAFFTKTGTQTFEDEIEGAFGFWGSVGASTFIFDPEVLYDPMSGRFFAMAADKDDSNGTSHALLAVSDDSDPNGTWFKYRLETTALAGSLFDSPNIGVDDVAVYITGDGFGGPAPYPIFIYDKDSLLAGNPPAIVNSLSLSTSTQSAGIPPVSFDNPPALYMIEHRENPSNTSVRLIALTDPLGSPTIQTTTLNVPSYGHPEDPPQMGTSARPETFDARFWSVAYRNGSLWATHHINSNRVLARWYEIAMNGWPISGTPPTLVQSGNIDPGPDVRTFFCAITVDAADNAGIVFARSAPNEFISMSFAYRFADDPLGTFQPDVIQQANTSAYSGSRWGDYAGIDVDPVDGETMWAHHEYAVGGSWRTWVSSFLPGPPPPANNNCTAASFVQDGAHAFTTIGALTDGFAEAACPSLESDVWFKYFAQCEGVVTASVCDADYDTGIAVYAAGCPDGPDQAIACNDDSCGIQSEVTFDASPGVYYFRIGGNEGDEGSGTLVIDCVPTATCAADCGDADGEVAIADLLQLLAEWGAAGTSCDIAPEPADGIVDVQDLLALLAAWGPCP
jgi:hypothetical protein